MAKTILIAVPTNKYIEPETMKSIYDLIVPEGYETTFQYFYGYQIDQIRNLIADWALKYDYLFSVDSDIVLPKDSLRKMLQADKDIISGLYIQRKSEEHILEVYQDSPRGGVENIPYWAIKDKGILPIAACGFGCVLIKSNVIMTMPYPHFYYTSAIDHSGTISEDVYFCNKARQLGFTMWVDTSILCEHIGTTKFIIDTPKTHLETIAELDLLPKEHANYLKTINIEPKVIYDIGACVGHWTRKAEEAWPDANFVLFDAAKSVKPFFDKSKYLGFISVLSDEDGKEVMFYEDMDNPGGNSYYKETTGAFTEQHKSTRITRTLDSLMAEYKLPMPDLIKLDVQGAELDILKGAKVTLLQCNDIILEAQHTEYNEGAPQVDEVIAYMESIGFELIKHFCQGEVDGDYHFSRKLV